MVSKSIAWLFDTANYKGGATNVTLVGITDTGTLYDSTQTVVFIGGEITSMITIVVIALVVILLLARYGPRLMRMRNK